MDPLYTGLRRLQFVCNAALSPSDQDSHTFFSTLKTENDIRTQTFIFYFKQEVTYDQNSRQKKSYLINTQELRKKVIFFITH